MLIPTKSGQHDRPFILVTLNSFQGLSIDADPDKVGTA